MSDLDSMKDVITAKGRTREQVEALSEGERNEAVALKCGYSWFRSRHSDQLILARTREEADSLKLGRALTAFCPNYCQDLNAIHEAIRAQIDKDKEDILSFIFHNVLGGDCHQYDGYGWGDISAAMLATASDYVVGFLMVMGEPS